MKKVILIRHAESEGNTGTVFEHQNIIKITTKGIKQATDLAETLFKPDRIICSKYIRTIETAEPFMIKYPSLQVSIWIDIHEFHPLNLKKHVGSHKKQSDNFVKNYWDQRDPFYLDEGNNENFKIFVDRVGASLRRMKKLKGTNYVFTHSYFIRCALILLKDYSNKKISKKKEYQEIMDKFSESHKVGMVIKNTEPFDITNYLKKY